MNDLHAKSAEPNGFLVPLSQEMRDQIARNRAEERERWSSLNLRQDFADEAFMRANLSAAGVRAPETAEPATPKRLVKFARRAGIRAQEFHDAVGMDAAGYLAKNPRLPLWAALAYVVELSGRIA